MAFIRDEAWPGAIEIPEAERSTLMAIALGRPASRILALAASLAMEALIFLLLVMRFGDGSSEHSAGHPSSLSLIEIGTAIAARPSSPSSTPSRKARTAPAPAAAPAPPSPLLASEWRATTLKVLVSAQAAGQPHTVPALPSGSGSASGAGGGAYDPYAGAAPQPVDLEACKRPSPAAPQDPRCRQLVTAGQ